MLVDTMAGHYGETEYEINYDSDELDQSEFHTLFNHEEVRRCFVEEDKGDAAIYRKIYQGKFVYHIDKDKWYKYVGPHWVADDFNESITSAEVIAEIYKQFKV
jgi:hypothetical protein